MKLTWINIAASLALMILLNGCAAVEKPAGSLHTGYIYVSNQSGSVDPVDIKIYIDDELLIDKEFALDTGHSWYRHKFEKPKGSIQIIAHTERGETTLDAVIPFPKNKFIVIMFWGNRFQISLWDEAPLFI